MNEYKGHILSNTLEISNIRFVFLIQIIFFLQFFVEAGSPTKRLLGFNKVVYLLAEGLSEHSYVRVLPVPDPEHVLGDLEGEPARTAFFLEELVRFVNEVVFEHTDYEPFEIKTVRAVLRVHQRVLEVKIADGLSRERILDTAVPSVDFLMVPEVSSEVEDVQNLQKTRDVSYGL